MIIKTQGYEIEIFDNCDVYLGNPKYGELFKKREELSDDVLGELERIQAQTVELVFKTQRLLNSA
jgi:hypothetical protein